jgi:putative nucleotidyltransferase with HDIG domain
MFKEILFLILGLICGLAIGFFARPKKKESPKTGPGLNPIMLVPLEPEKSEVSKLEEKIWHEEETSFIFKLNEQISLAREKELIASYIVEEVYRFLNLGACVIFLADEQTGDLKLEYALAPQEEMLKGFFLLKGESISGAVLNSKQPLLINDLENNYHYKSLNQEYYLKNSFISVPLVFKGEALGVLDAANKKTGQPFTKKDLDFLINVARIAAVAFKNVRLIGQIQEDYLKTITSLALIIDARDPYTKRHSENVTRYSLAIAKEIGWDLEQREMLKRAGLLHDIGKIGVRDGVLLKPGKLTVEEFAQIKIHSTKGEEIIRALPFLKDVALLVRQHHERYDGGGYPDGKKAEEINLGARILAVADSFDAMTTDRPYRSRLPLEVAREEIKRNKGTQFDPQIAELFLLVLDKNPAILS